jgi:DNA-binding NarL/FixJ family response regulator
LDLRKAERDAWQQSSAPALHRLSDAIHEQFRKWHLTPAESEVALLVLKGYSHKHIARATQRSERTARQHAAAVYHKAGLDGRAELAAYFLEGLLPSVEPVSSLSTEPPTPGPADSTFPVGSR